MTPNLTHAVSFLPLARSSVMLQYYNNIDQAALCDGLTEVVAMDLGLKETLFNRNIPTTWTGLHLYTLSVMNIIYNDGF